MHVSAARVLLVILSLAVVARAEEPTAFERRCAEIAARRGQRSEAARLHELFDASWEYQLLEYPEFATSVGDPRYNRRWTDWSLAAVARRERELDAPAHTLATIDRAALSDADQLSYDLFRRDLEMDLEGKRFKGEYLQMDQLSGVLQRVAQTIVTSDINTKVTVQRVGAFMVWMRPIIGATAAVIAYTLLLANAQLKVFFDGTFAEDFAVVAVIAIVAGFSERFIVGALGTIADTQAKK